MRLYSYLYNKIRKYTIEKLAKIHFELEYFFENQAKKIKV